MRIKGISLEDSIGKFKTEFVKNYKGRSFVHEIIPLSYSEEIPIPEPILISLRKFAENNPIYFRHYDKKIFGVECTVYEGDINDYWLNSKKHDTNYQPFYPTWLLSAYALAKISKDLGFNQIIDIGAGDGRIAYCAELIGMQPTGIEIDGSLVELQKTIFNAVDKKFDIIKEDATRFDFSSIVLESKPMFFISGLPEMGEMLAHSVISSVRRLNRPAGFNLMGSHVMKQYSRDQKMWGWGAVIEKFDLKLIGTVTLPTNWTTDHPVDTAYVYTKLE